MSHRRAPDHGNVTLPWFRSAPMAVNRGSGGTRGIRGAAWYAVPSALGNGGHLPATIYGTLAVLRLVEPGQVGVIGRQVLVVVDGLPVAGRRLRRGRRCRRRRRCRGCRAGAGA